MKNKTYLFLKLVGMYNTSSSLQWVLIILIYSNNIVIGTCPV